MSFAHPSWLLLAALSALAMHWVWRRFDRRQRVALGLFLSAHLRSELTASVSRPRIRIRRGLLTASIVLLLVALAGPLYGYRTEQVTRRGNDVIFAVDTSRSMLSPDVKPTRLARAKLAIDDFVGKLDGDGVGLVAFAGVAFMQSPVTLDYGAFRESLEALDTRIIPRGGTNIASAIQEADAAFSQRPGSDKILILVTDGEDLEGNVLNAAKQAAQHGVKIYTIGVGTQTGDLIPLPAEQGGGFLQDSSGQPVRSRLDATMLQQIATETGGTYAWLGNQGEGLDAIYRQALAPLAKHDLATREQRIYIPRFQWPLALSLALLVGSLFVNNRARGRADSAVHAGSRVGDSRVSNPDTSRRALGVTRQAPATGRPAPRTLSVIAAMALGISGTVAWRPARASAPSVAQSAYSKGDYASAARQYTEASVHDPEQPLLAFDAGTADYKAGDFAKAREAFEKALKAKPSGTAQRIAQDQDTYYDLGNTLYRAGQKSQTTNPDQTIQTWTQAVKSYDAALQLRSGDADSQFNRDLVARKIDELKKQQAQQNQQQRNQQQPSDKQQQSNKQQQANDRQQADKPQSGQQQAGNQQSGKEQPGKEQSGGSQADGRPDSAQQAKAEPQSSESASGQQPQKSADSPQAARPRAPGEMSAEEARELIDSMSADERHVGGAPIARATVQNRQPAEPAKDW